jgi:hypothetical protein
MRRAGQGDSGTHPDSRPGCYVIDQSVGVKANGMEAQLVTRMSDGVEDDTHRCGEQTTMRERALERLSRLLSSRWSFKVEADVDGLITFCWMTLMLVSCFLSSDCISVGTSTAQLLTCTLIVRIDLAISVCHKPSLCVTVCSSSPRRSSRSRPLRAIVCQPSPKHLI